MGEGYSLNEWLEIVASKCRGSGGGKPRASKLRALAREVEMSSGPG